MTEYGIHHLPVVEDGRPSHGGLRYVTRSERDPKRSRSGSASERGEVMKAKAVEVGHVTTRDVVSVTPDTPIKDVAMGSRSAASPASPRAMRTGQSWECSASRCW